MEINKIVRRPDSARGGITKEEELAMSELSKKWIANAMRTDTINPERLIPAIKKLYSVAGLKEPRVVIVPSPRVMAFAYGFSAAILYSRKTGFMPTRVATDDATRVATDDATRAATANATANATLDATRVATDDATLDAMDDATRAATYNATRAATANATANATLDATRVATLDATKDWAYKLALEIAGAHNGAMFMLRCAKRWYYAYQGGNMWSAWASYLAAGRDILGLKLPQHEKYSAWEECALEGGFRVMHEDFCIVSDFPEILKVDEQNRPHCDDGPSHRWRDGWSLYHIHGIRIPEEKKHIVLNPESITLKNIEDESNAEIRRIMIGRYGYERYLQNVDAVCVDSCPANHEVIGLRTAKLHRIGSEGKSESIYLLDMLNSTPEPDGTVKRYVIPIDPDRYDGEAGRNCHAAMASTWRSKNDHTQLLFPEWEEYRPIFES